MNMPATCGNASVLIRWLALFCLLVTVTTGCTTNPVTGERELLLIPESQELAIGREQYKPAQQAQGGQYTLDPDLTFYVQSVGNKLAAVSDRPDLPYEFVVLNNSVPNAWALPSGKIAINRGLLLALENEAQLAAVLGHEIVHAAARHGAKRMQQSLLVSTGMAGLGLWLGESQYQNLILGGAALGAQLTTSKYGRDNELESDLYGMRYMARAGYDPYQAVELQRIFVRLSEGRQSGWLEGLFASHPPSPERVARNEQTARELAVVNGVVGRDTYLKRTARIRKTEPAYAQHQAGLAALEQNNPSQALNLANQAIRIEPEESHFYALRADAERMLGRTQAAAASYDQAVRLNPDLYSHYLKRGMLQQDLGRHDAALADFKRSDALLPTSAAAFAQAESFQATNQTNAAIAQYARVSEVGGEVGQVALTRMATLDIARQPSRYLEVVASKDDKGSYYLAVVNRSPLAIATVRVRARLVNARGVQLDSRTISLNQGIAPQSRSAWADNPLAFRASQQAGTFVNYDIVDVALAER